MDKTSPVPAEASAAAPVEKPEQADAEAPEPEEAEEEPAENISNETFAEYAAAQWDYKKSIRASQLNDQFETDVTLTLPSAEVKLASEVCFVLDKSSFSDTRDKAMDLLTELKDAAEKTGARVQVDAQDTITDLMILQHSMIRLKLRLKNKTAAAPICMPDFSQQRKFLRAIQIFRTAASI